MDLQLERFTPKIESTNGSFLIITKLRVQNYVTDDILIEFLWKVLMRQASLLFSNSVICKWKNKKFLNIHLYSWHYPKKSFIELAKTEENIISWRQIGHEAKKKTNSPKVSRERRINLPILSPSLFYSWSKFSFLQIYSEYGQSWIRFHQ